MGSNILEECFGGAFMPNWASRFLLVLLTDTTDAITVGVDFTATDMQKQLAKEGLPWDLAKSFDGSLVLGSWLSIDQIKDVNMIQFNTNINETPQ